MFLSFSTVIYKIGTRIANRVLYYTKSTEMNYHYLQVVIFNNQRFKYPFLNSNGKEYEMMTQVNETYKIIILEPDVHERDMLRSFFGNLGHIPICFEKDNICFDNLSSLEPDIVIAKANSIEAAFRYLFAIRTVNATIPVILLSHIVELEAHLKLETDLSVRYFSPKISATYLKDAVYQLMIIRECSSWCQKEPVLVGISKQIQKIKTTLAQIGASNDSVLIEGEMGTGKELIARSIISACQSLNHFFLKISAAKLDADTFKEQIIKGPLFGRGSILADLNCNANSYPQITIFIDKIEHLSLDLQAKLLLIIEKGYEFLDVFKSGANVSIRFIATTCEDLDKLVTKNKFRADLLYRLNVIHLTIPPLRQRPEDIPLLTDYFLITICNRLNKSHIVPSLNLRKLLYYYQWPGNVIELKKLIEKFLVTGDEKQIRDYIPNIERDMDSFSRNHLDINSVNTINEIKTYLPKINLKKMSLKSICDEYACKTEKEIMRKALEYTNWNRKRAAALLNISYKSMLNKIKAYNLVNII